MVSRLIPALALACGFLCVSSICVSQIAPAATPAKAVSNYADESAVVERDDVVYRYANDGTGSRDETISVRLQSSAALQSFGVLSFPYASRTQSLQIVHTRVRKPDGSVIETPEADTQDQPAPVTQAAPMYSDLHLKLIPVRSLAVGDTLEIQLHVTLKEADIPGEFWGQESFGAGMVFLERSIELRVPKVRNVTIYSPKHTPVIADEGAERVYRWKGSQLRTSNAKEDDAVAEDKTPPVAWTTFLSWETLGSWYRGLIAGRDAVTPAIQAKADELTAGAKTDTEKVRALYDYVAQHNHYIGIDFGIGRYQPHRAAEVLTNQYGDCKDKHTLLAALLRAKGFQVSAVLIGMGIEMNEKVPMPVAFNHLITVVDVDGAPVWLDATTEVAPYRVLLSVLRDKQALVVPSTGAPHLAKTPAELPFAAVDSYEGVFDLDKTGATKGKVTIAAHGDDEVVMRAAFRQMARGQWDQLTQAVVSNTGFFGTGSATVVEGQEDLSAPWRLQYAYTQTPWSEWKAYRTGSLLPNVVLPSIDEAKPPKKEIDFGGKHTQTAKSTIHLPEGYGAELPDAIHLKTPFATFDETYQFKDGSLVSEFKLEVLRAKVDASEWKSVKKFADDLGVQPWIQLTSKEKAVAGKGPPAAGENNPVAAELVRQAQGALMEPDFDLARKKCDEAGALNEKQAYLWSVRASLAQVRKDYKEAVADYERELALHPDELEQYGGLIETERMAGNQAQEIRYLLTYAKVAPERDGVVLYAGMELLRLNNVTDAVEVYRAGAKALPENKIIQVELGSALFRAEKKEEAVTIIEKALEDTTDANLLNSGAYALANNHVQLPLAETSARKAVETLESESAATAITSVNARSFRQTTLLLATWDTLGWVYFAEGKLDLAEEYVQAAWKNAARSEEGLHMGEILEKKGVQARALGVYEMALSVAARGSGSPVAVALQSKVDTLKKMNIKVQSTNPSQGLQEQRTFHLPRPAGVKGSGIFDVQVSNAKTEKVEMVRGDESMRSLAASVAGIDLGLAVPKQSHALLLRSGVLFCSMQPTCEFVLTPPESANVK